MTINFAPRRGAIPMCNFGPDPLEPTTYPVAKAPLSMTPEIWKKRRIIVISPTALNYRHAKLAGLCTAVPCSATPPTSPEEWDVFCEAYSYPSFSRAVWAKCANVMTVSHARLDRVDVRGKKGFASDYVTAADMTRLEAGIRAALGL